MKPRPLALALCRALATLALCGAAQAAEDVSGQGTPKQLDTVVVQGQIVYRDRTEDTAPVLVYDLEYFQRFEPLTVGDMLKRVPSVAFVSDVLEYDGARLRGLDPGYTQILINGKKVPGAGDDRSFFVDRIPAELVERVEIVRSASANRSGDAVAGALNIVLRSAYEFDGAYLRAGALRFDDGEFKETYGGVASGEFAGGRLLGGVNVQGRYNPKAKQSVRFEEPAGDFVDREDQTDVRDGRDYSGNLSFTRDIGDSSVFSFSGLYVRTDRKQTENSLEYNDPGSTSPNNRLSVNEQIVDIDQRNLTLASSFAFDGLGGRNELDVDYARFEDQSIDTEIETSFDDEDSPPSFDETEGALILTDTDDSERGLSFAHQRKLGASELELGADYQRKDRETDLRISEVDTDEVGAALPPFDEFYQNTSRIEERRIDPYLMLTGNAGALRWETGLRYEMTDVDVAYDNRVDSNDYSELLPSLHLRWALNDRDRVNLSLARTVRRPNFNFILPLALEEEFGDNDFIGNPQLEQETANGIDLGFERRLGARGVIGFNLFYRDVADLIEIFNTGAPSATALDDFEDELGEFLDENPGALPGSPGYPVFDPDSFVYSAGNVGDGKVFGFEFDLSTPLSVIGLPDTGFFANYSWLDSEVDDFAGERTFNDQAEYVYNFGFIHDLPEAGVSFGMSYRKQGNAYSRLLAEEVETRYGADLEAFVEKRFGEAMSLRLTGSNLLNASKDEFFDKFDNEADQLDRDYDEFETETEEAGPMIQLIGRYAFK